jgi:hypothetical protein
MLLLANEQLVEHQDYLHIVDAVEVHIDVLGSGRDWTDKQASASSTCNTISYWSNKSGQMNSHGFHMGLFYCKIKMLTDF